MSNNGMHFRDHQSLLGLTLQIMGHSLSKIHREFSLKKVQPAGIFRVRNKMCFSLETV